MSPKQQFQYSYRLLRSGEYHLLLITYANGYISTRSFKSAIHAYERRKHIDDLLLPIYYRYEDYSGYNSAVVHNEFPF